MTTGPVAPSRVRHLIGSVAVFALLLQVLLAAPLALRMTAEAMQWLQFGATICTTTAGDRPASNDRPAHPLPVHDHGQCVICQAHMLLGGLLPVLLLLLLAEFDRTSTRRSVAIAPPWRRDRYRSYHSRAPPVVA